MDLLSVSRVDDAAQLEAAAMANFNIIGLTMPSSAPGTPIGAPSDFASPESEYGPVFHNPRSMEGMEQAFLI